MKLGDMLQLYMQQRNLSFRDVGKQIGCDHSTVHRMVQGEPVRVDVLIKFIAWLLAPDKK
jgi:predicted transcriptional regulator